MAVGVQKAWSLTAGSNGNADDNINVVEGSGFKMPQINDSMRAMMAALKGWANQISGAKTTGGSANAQTFTSDSVAALSTAYAAGMSLKFKAGFSNSGAATLNVDAIGATAIRKGGAETALAANDIVANGVYTVTYNGTYWILENPETGQNAAGHQPLDATLTAYAAQTTGADLIWYWTGTDAGATTSLTSVARTLLAQTTQALMRTTGLGMSANGSSLASAADYAAMRALLDLEPGVDYVALTGGTFTGNLSISKASPVFTMNAAAAGQQRQLRGQTNGVNRWVMYFGDDAAESGTNAGSSFAIYAFDDAGSSLGAVLEILRATRVMDFKVAPTINGVAFLTTASTLANRLATSSETSGALTAASANKHLALSGNVTLDNSVFTAGDKMTYDPGTSDRTFTRGSGVTMYLNGANVATATLAANQMGGSHHRSASVVILSGGFV